MADRIIYALYRHLQKSDNSNSGVGNRVLNKMPFTTTESEFSDSYQTEMKQINQLHDEFIKMRLFLIWR